MDEKCLKCSSNQLCPKTFAVDSAHCEEYRINPQRAAQYDNASPEQKLAWLEDILKGR